MFSSYKTDRLAYIKRSFWNHVKGIIWKVVILFVVAVFILAFPMFSSRLIPVLCVAVPIALVFLSYGIRRNWVGAKEDWAEWHEKPKRVIGPDGELIEVDEEVDIDTYLRQRKQVK